MGTVVGNSHGRAQENWRPGMLNLQFMWGVSRWDGAPARQRTPRIRDSIDEALSSNAWAEDIVFSDHTLACMGVQNILKIWRLAQAT